MSSDRLLHLLDQMKIDERTFFNRTWHLGCPLGSALFLVAPAHNQLVGALVRAGLIALGRRPPRRYRMTSAGSAAFAAAVWMIDRFHGDAAHRRADAAPTLGSGFAKRTRCV